MEDRQTRKEAECRVVVGPEETAAARAAWPGLPIVALVEASEPSQAVYARCAGADVVLPTADLASGWRNDTPGLAVAVSAAISLAERRNGIRESSRRSGHDLGQALSAINLAAELAISDTEKSERLLHQIQNQVRAAGTHAWKAGRAGRSSGLALRPVDLSALLHRLATAEPDVAVYDSSGSAWVLGDVGRIEHLLEELIQHGRQSTSSQRIDVTIGRGGTVEITIRRTGHQRSKLPERDVEFGLLAVTEIVNDLGGQLHFDSDNGGAVRDAGGPLVRLSLPVLPYRGQRAGVVTVPPDRMAIQADILEGVLRHVPLPESLEAIVAAIERQLPGTKCSVLLLEGGETLHHGAGASLPEAYRREIDGVAIGYGQGSCGTAAFLGQPVIAADVETNKHWVKFKDLALAHDLRSCWSTPILAADGGAVLGTFAVYRSEVSEPDVAATHLISRFTYLAAVAIGHHRLFNALAESESRFRNAFEASQAKTDFLAVVSHELRTPLNAILGFAQVMKLVDLDASQRADSIDNILKVGQHLRGLVGELLDLSLIEGGQFRTEIENIDARDAIDEALQILQPLADSREITLHQGMATVLAPALATALQMDSVPQVDTGIETGELDLDHPNPKGPTLHADRRCLRQVLINLLGNALKFTPPGGEVGIVADDISETIVRIRVLDTGPGIAANAIDDLFQPFRRLPRNSGSDAEGTGLGLSVATQLAEEMGGSIGVESRLGSGSCFWIDLPTGKPPKRSADHEDQFASTA